jgi:hypothetical protein
VGRTFETTPDTYAVHDEEALRNVILSHLNVSFEGAATGETFRRSGKTDIRIESGKRAAFVGECKVWKGAKELGDAVNQLLGYLTWRDCKAAIVVFNKKNAKFSALIENIPTAFQSHPKFVQRLNSGGEGEWEYRMTSLEDEGRTIRVHVFAFNLFAP